MGATSILYQGLQSCMEPQLPQQHVLINKLSPPPLTFSHSNSNINTCGVTQQQVVVELNELESEQSDNGDHNKDNNIGGWSCIQDLSNPRRDHLEKQVYVHPRSSNIFNLSTKSLEMCTESLGSETGSDISETNIEEHSFSLSETQNSSHLAQPSKRRQGIIIGRDQQCIIRVANFPPPLTSLSRTNNGGGVQVRPHREGGHLILKATTVSAPKSYFKTERIDGRLRLFLLNNTRVETEAEAQDDENDHADESDDGNTKNIVSENGYIRPSKCKENGSRIKGIPSWEPFWVAIS